MQSVSGFARPAGILVDPARVRASVLTLAMLGALGLSIAFGLLPAGSPPGSSTADLVRDAADDGGAPGDTRPGTIHRSSDGLFYVHLRANGTSLRCLVDTGASDLVLSSQEAAHVGLSPENIGYGHKVVTAGGLRAAARTQLQTIDVAGHRFRQVPLVLVKGGETPCLMGQNLLMRLDDVRIHGGELRLR